MKRLILAILAALVPGAAAAQSFPQKPVHIINPFTAGGPNDLLARAVGHKLNEAWGQPVASRGSKRSKAGRREAAPVYFGAIERMPGRRSSRARAGAIPRLAARSPA